jgi:hypothetical protein
MAMSLLAEAVKSQLGSESDREFKEELAGVREGGANAGFSGFIYYKDTVKFYDENEEEIWEALEEDAEGTGMKNALSLIASFSGAEHVSDSATFKNLLAWYALERVAQEYDR